MPMSYIYEVFENLLRLWMGIWLHTHTVVSCKLGTQDVCTMNKVLKYPSMCKMEESVHAAIETQRRIFCLVSRYSISETNGWSQVWRMSVG
jgi:hypothetical protein